jgi:Xaa-Pro aminopeptidase
VTIAAGADRWAGLDFDRSEYERRLAGVREEMRTRDADVLLVDQLDHVAWLFGYLPTAARYQAAIVPLAGEPHMVVRALDEPAFLTQSWVSSYETCADAEDSLGRVANALRARTNGRAAVEKDSNLMTAQRMEQLESALPGLQWIDFSGVIWEQRLVKSPAELNYLERAARIADACLMAGIDAVQVGASERTPAIATYARALELGADNGRVATFGYGTTVESMHGRLEERVLQAGETLFIEALPQVRGYSARTVRPVSIGHPAPDRLRLAERLIAIQDEQIAAMRPGADAAEVDAICRESVLRERLKTTFPQLTGYTLGYHAVPRTSDHTRIFAPGANWRLEEDMVFHMILFTRGLPFSETVHVTAEGPRRLTRTSRELFIR